MSMSSFLYLAMLALQGKHTHLPCQCHQLTHPAPSTLASPSLPSAETNTLEPRYPHIPHYFHKVAKAHGITGSTAWCLVLPLGAILLRLWPSGKPLAGSNKPWKPSAFWMHVLTQTLGLMLYLVNFAQGVYMAHLTDKFHNYHVYIGIVIFAFAFTQPITGWVHHVLFLKGRGRTSASHVHVWLGRALITLGAINGGLGLLLLAKTPYHAQNADYIIYGVITAVVWLVYVGVAVWFEVKRARAMALEEPAEDVVVHMGEKKTQMLRQASDRSEDSATTIDDDADADTLAKDKYEVESPVTENGTAL